MVAKSGEELNAAKARYDQEVLATSAQAEKNYWALYAAERDYAVQKLTRDRGEAFLRETEMRAKAGLVGPNQVANAKTFLAEQQIFLLDREEQLDRLSDQLASFIGVRPDENQRRFIIVDNPREEFALQEVNALIDIAIKNNLEIKAAESDVEAKRALASAAWWEALPSVNLVGSLGGNGLSGTPQDVIFGSDTLRTTVNGGFSDAVSQAIERKFPSWSVGVEVSIPLGFRSGFGEKDRLDAEVVIAEQRYIQQKRMLEDHVRSVYNELVHSKARLSAARAGVEAAQEQVRIGIIEFQNGRTTAFELVRLGADFAVAQQRYTQALVRGANAAVDLQLLTSGSYSSGN
jgi:outer membrane protein TolC